MCAHRLLGHSLAGIVVAISMSASVNAADFAPSYGPATDPTQRFGAPENSARPGETFFYKAARAASREEYKFAIDMYRVSASWAFKPAQYNLGVMYFNGEGVAVDRALGMAWLALAAERDDKDYASARDIAYTKMSSEEFARANELWRDLRKTYGDQVALTRAKNRWLQVRRAATGSHLGAGMGPLLVGGRNTIGRNTFSAFDVTGAGAIDGSIAYRRSREADNPYDDKLKQPTGTVTVQDVIPGGDDVKSVPPGGKPSHFY